jgi:uncharacterized protein YciI
VPAHVEYWHSRDLGNYLGGPFTDRTGGLITFAADTMAAAQHTILQDPFVRERLIEQSWIEEWRVE